MPFSTAWSTSTPVPFGCPRREHLPRRSPPGLYDLHDGSRDLIDGVQFESRHGDELTLWAVFERGDDGDASARLAQIQAVPLHPDDPALIEAFRIHRLTWMGTEPP